MHDLLFQNPKQLDLPSLQKRGRSLKLESKKFDSCLGGEATDQVRQDLAGGRALGITGTPTFLFGRLEPDGRLRATERLTGAQPFEAFRVVLDKLLQTAAQK